MGLFHSPKIVTDGLVLCLDAANPKSYPGSGTTWYDLSGNNHDGTLINSPDYDSVNKGFTGFYTNEYIEVGNSPYDNIPYGTSDRTIFAFFKTPSSLAGYQHIFHYGTSNTNQSFGLALQSGYLNNHTWSGNSLFNDYVLSSSTDYIVAVRYSDNNSPKNDFFVNSDFGVTGYGQGKTSDYSITTGTTFSPRIGTRISSYYEPFSSGIIKGITIYNKALTASEIQQNFNALRGRYGI